MEDGVMLNKYYEAYIMCVALNQFIAFIHDNSIPFRFRSM